MQLMPMLLLMHLNTSHVKVKQFEVELSGNWISDLNTSHVKVKLKMLLYILLLLI